MRKLFEQPIPECIPFYSAGEQLAVSLKELGIVRIIIRGAILVRQTIGTRLIHYVPAALQQLECVYWDIVSPIELHIVGHYHANDVAATLQTERIREGLKTGRQPQYGVLRTQCCKCVVQPTFYTTSVGVTDKRLLRGLKFALVLFSQRFDILSEIRTPR